jgi:hypothetical protein
MATQTKIITITTAMNIQSAILKPNIETIPRTNPAKNDELANSL